MNGIAKKSVFWVLLFLLTRCAIFIFLNVRKTNRLKELDKILKVSEEQLQMLSKEELEKSKASLEETRRLVSRELSVPIIITVYFGIVGVLVLIVLWYLEKKK